MTTSILRHLAALSAEAHTAGRESGLFDWWGELASLVQGLGVGGGGSIIKIGRGWVGVLLPDSPCCALAMACNIARPRGAPRTVPLKDWEEADLAKLCAVDNPAADPVVTTTRLLAWSAIHPANLSFDTVVQVTAQLLDCVRAVAIEFEA